MTSRRITTPDSGGAVATTGQASASEAPAGNIRVEANRDWTDTGITVQRGERLMVNPTGNINLGPGHQRRRQRHTAP